jgi:hypothetical protein
MLPICYLLSLLTSSLLNFHLSLPFSLTHGLLLECGVDISSVKIFVVLRCILIIICDHQIYYQR